MEPNVSTADGVQFVIARRPFDRVANGRVGMTTVHDAMTGRVAKRDRKFSSASRRLSEDGVLNKKINPLILNRHVFGIFGECLCNALNHRAREYIFLIAPGYSWIDLHETFQLFWQVRNLHKAVSNFSSTKSGNWQTSIVVRWDGKCERQRNARDYSSSSAHISSRRKEKRPAAYLDSRRPT